MNPASSSEKDLLIADLRLRLAEAEETLRAIRENEVDALVMRGHVAEEIFTIVGDAESYRTFMEVMEPGAAALDGFGRVLYANSTLTHLLGKSLAELQGKLFTDVLTARHRQGNRTAAQRRKWNHAKPRSSLSPGRRG